MSDTCDFWKGPLHLILLGNARQNGLSTPFPKIYFGVLYHPNATGFIIKATNSQVESRNRIIIKIAFLAQGYDKEIFDLIADISKYSKWVTQKSRFFIENKTTTAGPIRLSTSYVDKLKQGRKAFRRIVEYEPSSKIRFQQ